MSRHTRARGVRSPHYCNPRPHHWTPRERQIFSEWIACRQMDNEMQLIRLQTQQNRVVIEILDAEAQIEGKVTHASWSQRPPLVRSHQGRKLLRVWDDLDRQIRCARHIERLLSPLYSLTIGDGEAEFVSNDPITLFFWGQCQLDYPNIDKINLDVPHKEVNTR
ncbi:hypothetical protein EON83_25805 [bacterium]|nr:MAG: hypothetical protein EON83_25805 [bacterium]